MTVYIKKFPKLLFISFFLTLLFSCKESKQESALSAVDQSNSLVDFVNPLMGTDSDFSLSTEIHILRLLPHGG